MTRRARDDSTQFLKKILPYVESEGARNFGIIARDFSLPYPTVSFRMQHLKDLGISIVPIVNVDRLGLARVRASFFLGKEKLPNLKHFFTALNENSGLRYYSKSLINFKFDSEFAVPSGKVRELAGVFEELEKMNLVSEVELHEIKWKDFPTLKTEFFDYPAGEWDVDFSRLIGDPSVRLRLEEDAELPIFDYKDLMILKELEIEPWVKEVELARKIGCPVRDISYHLRKHVLEKNLASFKIRWIGTQQAWAKHSIVGMTFQFKNISETKSRHLISILSSVPFLWSHLRTFDGIYLAEVLIPISALSEATKYISDRLEQVSMSPEILLNDWSCSSNYTIPYQLFDKVQKTWAFDSDKIMTAIAQKSLSRS